MSLLQRSGLYADSRTHACGARLFGTHFTPRSFTAVCSSAEADSRSTAPTDGFGPPMHRHRAYVWLGDAADPLRALPTSASSAVKFSCTACDARIDGAVYMASDMPYCCEAHRDGPRRRSALLFPSSNSTVQFAPLHHLQPRVRSSSSGDLATSHRRRSVGGRASTRCRPPTARARSRHSPIGLPAAAAPPRLYPCRHCVNVCVPSEFVSPSCFAQFPV